MEQIESLDIKQANSATAFHADALLLLKQEYLLHLADNTLILAQKNSDWCGHGPVLEQDIALTNISLDLLGQAQNFYTYAALLSQDAATTADSLAFLRQEREYKNCLLVEQPNGDWGVTIFRQFLFSVYQYELYNQLKNNADETIAAIAIKSLKEVTYHVRWSSEWIIRLGDGTLVSHQKMLHALEQLWPFTGEFFIPAKYEEEAIIGFDLKLLQPIWQQKIFSVLEEAKLLHALFEKDELKKIFMQKGGKQGLHSEQMGYILTDMQFLQRAFPGAEW